MELSFSAPPAPLDAAPAAADPAAASPAFSCSPQPQPESQLEADAAAPAPADDRFHVSGMCLPVLFLDFILMWNLVAVEVLICRVFSVFFPVAVEVLLHATSVARHEEVQAAVEKSVFAQLSVSVTHSRGVLRVGDLWAVLVGWFRDSRILEMEKA
jgi:pachytene checkpoint protein 2